VKRALVTGGSGTLGRAIAQALAARGHFVYVHAHRRPEEAQAVVARIAQGGGHAKSIVFDVADRDACREALSRVLEAGPVQILVNNAGFHDDAPLAGMSGTQWDRVVDVVLNGFFNVTQPLLLPMMATRWGRIVNVASIAALAGNRGQANYAAAKAGLIGLTKALAAEVASRNITVNCVAPGFIESPMTDALNATQREAILGTVPMARLGSGADVAAAILYLASEESGYVTGHTLHVNGGMAML
jgi:3-oxoacyl-[acyl-carrier protein] reductase